MRKGQRFEVLDGMRGVAAVAVVLFHLASPSSGFPPWAWANGDVAVDFFFALSGFVLANAHAYELATGRLKYASFMRLRLIRVWPMVALGTVVGAAASPTILSSSKTFLTAALSLFSLPYEDHGAFIWINAVFWSLFAEIVVNAIYGVCAKTVPRKLVILLALVAIGYVAIVLSHRTLPMSLPRVDTAPITVLRVTTLFFLGVAVRTWMPERVPATVPAVLPIAGLGAMLWVPGAVADRPLELIMDFTLIPALVWLGAKGHMGDRPTIRAWMGALGGASFPLYAIHSPLVNLLRPHLLSFAPPERLLVVIGFVTSLLCAAFLVDRFIDRPARSWLRRSSNGAALASG